MMKKLLVAVVLAVSSAAAGAQDAPVAKAAQLEIDYRIVPNVTYLTASNWDAKADLYVTRTPDKPLPTLLFIHGGGWSHDSKDRRNLVILPYLLMGMNVINIEYRLGPVALAPAAVEDCRCALRWVIQHAKEYGVDVNRIVVAGDSAGGHLALTTGMLPASAGLDRQCPGPDNLKVAAILNWYGISDVNELLDGPNMQTYAVGWLGSATDREAIAKRVSPIAYVRAGLPPVLTVHGTADPAVPYAQSVRFHKALSASGVPNELLTMPGGRHGVECCTVAQRTDAYAKIREFLTRAGVLEAPKAPAFVQGAARQEGGKAWVSTWATGVVGRPRNPEPLPPPPAPSPNAPTEARPRRQPAPFMHFNNQTLRQIVRASVGGGRVRVVLSNAFGTMPLAIGAAQVALRSSGAAIDPASSRSLTFGGRTTFEIPPGAVAFSDPVALVVPPLADMAVDLYLPGDTNSDSPLTMHSAGGQTNYVSETGNHTGRATLPVAATAPSWFVISRVEVEATRPTNVVVAFGDSITEGARSTPDTNNSWPSHLARRFAESALAVGVANAGIGGNKVIGERSFPQGVNALARFDRDALAVTGVTHVLVLEGINDIQYGRETPSPSADDIIAGHQQLIERAHARGLKIYGATLTPFAGAGSFGPVAEAKRQAVNQWIRSSRAYDGVIDFEAATRDPRQIDRIASQYDSVDHLHPNDAGYRAMADAIDLSLFTVAPAR